MTPLDVATAVLLLAGGVFFLAATLGLLRFPDTMSRLHALTKADNLGLGLLAAGLALQADGVVPALKLVLVWAVAMVAGSCASYLVARHALMRARGEDPGP